MNVYEKILFPIICALTRDDPEKAHNLAIRACKITQHIPFLVRLIAWRYGANKNPSPVTVAGIKFPNRIGLAAGFDKNGETLRVMQALGFGFVEVGTVVPHPQSGNPKPRMFRFPKHYALINRMGFNSAGVLVVAANLRKHHRAITIPIGINIGKMRDTPLNMAFSDYAMALGSLREYDDYPYADYLVVNVSSPNTPGLRKLQYPGYLENLMRILVQVERIVTADCASIPYLPRAIFVKISPDLSEEEVNDTIGAAVSGGASGFVVANTTTCRPRINSNDTIIGEQGGFSGPAMFPRTLQLIKQVRSLTNLPIIGAGGIQDADTAQQAFDAGADLLQILTGFVYRGPRLITELRDVQPSEDTLFC